MRRAIKAALIEFSVAMAAAVLVLLFVLWVMQAARAGRGKPMVAPPEESMRWIQRCAIAMLTVDGLPVYRHAWCRYDPETSLFEPLEKDLDRAQIIDIKREDE